MSAAETGRLADLFDELCLRESDDRWVSIRRVEGRYEFIDIRRPKGKWMRYCVVGLRSVREAVERSVRGDRVSSTRHSCDIGSKVRIDRNDLPVVVAVVNAYRAAGDVDERPGRSQPCSGGFSDVICTT